MPFFSKRPKLKLAPMEKEELTVISKSRTESKSRVERAKMLLYYSEGGTTSSIAPLLHTNRPEVERCIDKALHFGVMRALNDLPRPGRPSTITPRSQGMVFIHSMYEAKRVGPFSGMLHNGTTGQVRKRQLHSKGASKFIEDHKEKMVPFSKIAVKLLLSKIIFS